MDEQPRTGHTSSVCVQLHKTLADVPPDSMSMAQSRDISQQHGPKAAVAAFTTKEICRFLASLGSTPQATAAAQGPQQASGHQPLASITPLWPKLRLASGGREELKPSSRHTACQPPPEAAAAAGIGFIRAGQTRHSCWHRHHQHGVSHREDIFQPQPIKHPACLPRPILQPRLER